MVSDIDAERESATTKTPIGKFICTKCGDQGDYTSFVEGSLIVEIGIWSVCIFLAFYTFGATVLIAIGYSLWRYFSVEKGCPKCKGLLIETDSPRGKIIIEKFGL